MLMSIPAEFAVAGIEDIQWSNLPFQSLVIPTKKKDMLQALVQPYKPDAEERPFDDFVEGKGKGLIILLQFVSLHSSSLVTHGLT